MEKFYFTYGTDGKQPFIGGWTEVIAPDRFAAYQTFRDAHPDRFQGILNCAFVYSEEEFKKSIMSGPNGNFGRFCHETLIYQEPKN